jgi:uncharacterized OsmC-like protein
MTTMTMRSPSKTANNGVNVAALLGAREALSKAPAAAAFKWRVACEWINGTHSRSAIGTFFGLGADQSRKTTFSVEADHPEVFAAEDQAPTPVEIVLSGLASCLTAGVAAVAQNRGIQLHSVKSTVEADMDLQGILGIDEDVRNGFSAISVHFDIKSDATPEEIEAVVAQSQKRSAVYDIITNPTNVTVVVK